MSKYLLGLACGDFVTVDGQEPVRQYPSDTCYARCVECQANPSVPLSWQKIETVKDITADDLRELHAELPQVLPENILRVQPSVPRNRVRPFPWRRKR